MGERAAGVVDRPGVDDGDDDGHQRTPTPDRRFRPDVEGLRALAIVLVVLYHAGLQQLRGGYVGVDVFFVISGFVITGVLLRERSKSDSTSFVAFYARRARRILPAATLVILVTLVATYVVLGDVSGNATAADARWTAIFFANWHFASLNTNYLTSQLPPSPLLNFWSLGVEEQFYIVFPALFAVVAVVARARPLRQKLFMALLPVVVLSLALSVWQTTHSPTAAYFSPFTRAWELALGAMVAAGSERLRKIPPAVAASATWLGLGAVVVAAVAYTSTTTYPGILVAVPVIGTALVIAGGTSVPLRGAERLLGWTPVRATGRISYSLYLWHWPIFILAAEKSGVAGLPFHKNLPWLVLAVALSIATYLLVENPIRRSRPLAVRPWLALAIGAVLVGAALVAATVALNTHGGAVVEGGKNGARPAGGHVVIPPPAPLSPTALERLVRAAPSIRELPADLTPPLEQVHDNWGGPGPPCWPSTGQTSIPASCTFGDPAGTHTLAVYGDSHAAMWLTAIDAIATADHWRVVYLGKGYCPADSLPFGNPPGWGNPNGEYAACDAWHRFALERMREVHPDLVVVTQELADGVGGNIFSARTWGSGLQKTISELPVPPSRVLVLGNMPIAPSDPAQCLSQNAGNVQSCSASPSAFVLNHNAAERQAARRTGATYVDVTPWFCSSTCSDVIGRYTPYWDRYHVTADYSIALESVLGGALNLEGRSS